MSKVSFTDKKTQSTSPSNNNDNSNNKIWAVAVVFSAWFLHHLTACSSEAHCGNFVQLPLYECCRNVALHKFQFDEFLSHCNLLRNGIGWLRKHRKLPFPPVLKCSCFFLCFAFLSRRSQRSHLLSHSRSFSGTRLSEILSDTQSHF